MSLQSVFAGKAESAGFMSANVGFDLIVRLQMRVQMASKFELFGTADEGTLKLADIQLLNG